MSNHRIKLFALGEDRRLTVGVAERLGVDVAPHELRVFADGECKVRPLSNVRGREVFVLASLAATETASVNDALCRLLIFVGALKDAAAARVTAVVPYLCYSRKDRKTKPRDPVSTRYVAQLLEAVGVSQLVTVDVHNPAAFQNAFRIQTETLDAARVFAAPVAAACQTDPVTVLSPDLGGVHRAETFRRALAAATPGPVGFGFMEKWRSEDVVWGDVLAADVVGKTVVIYDDMISTGVTLARAAAKCKERGAHRVLAAAAHGVFTPGADKALASPALDRVFVTNTVPLPAREGQAFNGKLEVVDAAPLVAHAIESILDGSSISAMTVPRDP